MAEPAALFGVKNFEKFQHYKKRNPPWIKLYNALLDDYAFGLLPDATKMHLVAIWLLASRHQNAIPFDPEWVARRINATEPVDLVTLAATGFIIPNQTAAASLARASNMLASCKQVAMPEREPEVGLIQGKQDASASSLSSDSDHEGKVVTLRGRS